MSEIPEPDPLFEFNVDGPPVSAQAKRKDTREKWKQRVRQAASSVWPAGQPPFVGFLTLEITYFCNDLAAIDAEISRSRSATRSSGWSSPTTRT